MSEFYPYDVAYQDWLAARRAGDYATADHIRGCFERYYALTIIAEGEMPLEGVTVQRMKASTWEKKYGSPEVGRYNEMWDSQVKRLYPEFTGTMKSMTRAEMVYKPE